MYVLSHRACYVGKILLIAAIRFEPSFFGLIMEIKKSIIAEINNIEYCINAKKEIQSFNQIFFVSNLW